MINSHKEHLSSLLDDELRHSDTSALIKAFEADQDLHEQFDRYALIRDALNDDVVIQQESFSKEYSSRFSRRANCVSSK